MNEVSLLVILVSIASLIVSCICVATCVGMARATHSVQYVEYDPFKGMSSDEKEIMKNELSELKKSNDEIMNRSIGRIREDGQESKKSIVIKPPDTEIGLDEI